MSLIKNTLYGLTLTLGLTGIALADEPPASTSTPAHAAWKDHFDPVHMASHHLEELKHRLEITDKQRDAWKTFSDSVMAQAKDMADLRHKMMHEQEKLTAPDRMHRMADAMALRARGMKTVADAAKTLYDQLSPKQQATFNEMAATNHRHMMHDMQRKDMDKGTEMPGSSASAATH